MWSGHSGTQYVDQGGLELRDLSVWLIPLQKLFFNIYFYDEYFARMHGHCVHAWYPRQSEEGVQSPRTGVTENQCPHTRYGSYCGMPKLYGVGIRDSLCVEKGQRCSSLAGTIDPAL